MVKLSLDGQSQLLVKMSAEYADYIALGLTSCPKDHIYKISSRIEGPEINGAARIAALRSINVQPIRKYAFDTRRVDQENDRNPRHNLQYWHRSEAFIDEEDKVRLTTFAGLMTVLEEIKKEYGSQPEWFASYARILHDNVYGSLRIKQADLDIYKPQLNYLEQLVFARYRLSMEDLKGLSKLEIKARIMSKDEELLKRGEYMKETGFQKDSAVENKKIVIDGNAVNQQSLVEALFGNNGFRREGEKTVTRTIKISITDSVEE